MKQMFQAKSVWLACNAAPSWIQRSELQNLVDAVLHVKKVTSQICFSIYLLADRLGFEGAGVQEGARRGANNFKNNGEK